ncbi:MAG TPA: CheR family methyltransferase, partial [Thermoanaerobaculia bacterium]
WVSGCSTGQEAYSLAMAFLEYLEKSSSRVPLQIFATDLSDAVSLRKAREGRYPESIEAELTPERLQHFFTKEDGHYRISKAVRDLCVFARQDVAADPPFSRMDLVSCRNLLIYLSPRLQKRVIPTFHYALSPGGFLLLGSAETIGPFADLFGVVDPRHRIYVKTGTHPRQYPHFHSGEAAAAGIPGMPGVPAKIPVPAELPALQGEAGRLLRLPVAGKAVKPAGVRVLPVELPGNTERCFLVVLDGTGAPAEQTAPAPRKRRRWPWNWLRRDEPPAVQLRQELSSTRESLQGVIEQQDVDNEELRSAVEEALSANEELQSTNEELETAKEELQSVNEELTTVNEQLQNRNADLREAAERLAEADRRKDEFLATLAHELRNPLAPLRNALEILRLAEGPDQLAAARGLMERQVRQMSRLIDDLLDVSRINLGRIDLRRERIELAVAVNQAVEACTPGLVAAGHEISVLLPAEALVLNADPLRLSQIFENLLGNAVRYTEPGGRIRLAVSREGDEAVIRLSDTGIGIAPDKLDLIWEPFMQVDPSFERSRNGLGIGLTLVRKLVQLHGGTVEARSEGLGHGSEFIVHLPLVEDRRGAPVPQPEEPSVSAPLRILVVDDNVDQAESFGTLLRLMGHEVLVVHGGPAALAAAASFKPALGLLDIGMPGLSGYEVARQLRKLPGLEQIILVAVSGYGTEEDRRRSKEAGFHAHWTKPVDLDLLRTLLAQLGEASPLIERSTVR